MDFNRDIKDGFEYLKFGKYNYKFYLSRYVFYLG